MTNDTPTERYTGECEICNHRFVEATSEDVIDHILDEHGQYIGNWNEIESMVVFDFPMSREQIEYLYRREQGEMTDDWSCPYCGRVEDDTPPHSEIMIGDGEVTADVTCRSVNLMRDDGYGIALDFEEFERIAEMFNQVSDGGDAGE